MNVDQVIALAKEWVELHGNRTPGFCGAHLMGSILSMPKEAPFPLHRDVDVMLVLADAPHGEGRDIAYEGVLLQCGESSIDKYRSPDAVLSDPGLACNLAADGILADPTGLLTSLRAVVARDYACRAWVRARCSAEKELGTENLEGLGRAASPNHEVARLDDEPLWLLSGTVLFLSGLLAVASLVCPTYRRSLVLMGQLLREHGRADLHEEALRLLGYDRLTRQQVEAFLGDCTAAFDKAVESTNTWIPFGYSLKPHVRPYIVDGSQEMIDEGYHREAMFWIASYLMIANNAIRHCAPDAAKPPFQAMVDRLVEEVGLTTPTVVLSRYHRAQDLAARIFAVADDAVARLPESDGQTGDGTARHDPRRPS